MIQFFRRLRGQYKLMRIARHLSIQIEPYMLWQKVKICPENIARAHALLDAAAIVLDRWKNWGER